MVEVWKFIRELTRQFTGAASQVNDFEIWAHIHKREQIIKWRGALGLKFMIKIWIPRHSIKFPSP